MLFKWFKCQLLVDLMLTNSVFQCLQAREKKSDLGKCKCSGYKKKPSSNHCIEFKENKIDRNPLIATHRLDLFNSLDCFSEWSAAQSVDFPKSRWLLV